MNKRRKLRLDRLALLVLIGFCVAYTIISLTGKFITVVANVNEDTKQQEQKVELGKVDEKPIIYEVNITTLEEEEPIEKENNLIEVEEEIIEEPILEYLGEFKITGYCPCEECCGQWSGGPTASGVMPTPNHTIAVDPNVIPLGTHVMIDGIEYVAEDTGSAINEKKIDIFVAEHHECFSEFCNGYKDVYLIKESD